MALTLHDEHERLHARFTGLQDLEAVEDYGDVRAEHAALGEHAGLLDLSFRSRLCLVGADRQKFLHGQVTNDVARLRPGQGCYAALITAKGRMESDLNIYALPEELLLDFEPGLAEKVRARLEKYIIADDVTVVDVAPHYGMLSIQGPSAPQALAQGTGLLAPPVGLMDWSKVEQETRGEIYVTHHPRTGTAGYDLFVPLDLLAQVWRQLVVAVRAVGGRPSGWRALETRRLEAGLPRFGADMDETNLPPEAGLDHRAMSYTKGCYIGQEIMARLRTYGQVAKSLRGLRLPDDLPSLPIKGEKLFSGEREIGYITSSVRSLAFDANIALAYVRREVNQVGTELFLKIATGLAKATIVDLPFQQPRPPRSPLG